MESADYFRVLTQEVRDILLFMDEAGLIFEANHAAEMAYGYSREELLGMRIQDLREQSTLAEMQGQFSAALASGVLFETLHRRKDGSVFPCEVSSKATTGKGGRKVVVSVIRDITKRREAERQLEHARHLMIETAKAAALSSLMGGLLHGVNTPLGILALSIEDLKGLPRVVADQHVRHRLDRMDKAVERISGVLQSLRVLCHGGDRENREVVPLTAILEDFRLLWEERLKSEGVLLSIGPTEPDLVITCNRRQISQVLNQLISNSSDSLAGVRDGWIRMEAEKAHSLLRIRISDNGHGVPETIRNRIFDPFYTTRDPAVHTGLGLAVCKGWVEDHAGRLFLDREDRFTCFVLELPL